MSIINCIPTVGILFIVFFSVAITDAEILTKITGIQNDSVVTIQFFSLNQLNVEQIQLNDKIIPDSIKNKLIGKCFLNWKINEIKDDIILQIDQHNNEIKSASLWIKTLEFLKDNVIWSFVLAILGIVIPLWYKRKYYEIILIGCSGVGKSVLLERFFDNYGAIPSGSKESTIHEVKKSFTKTSSNGKTIFKFDVCDIGGQYSYDLFNRLIANSKIQKRKKILVYVLSPFKCDDNKKPIKGVDHNYISRQLGWTESLVKGYIKSDDGKFSCQGILIFLNMFDLYDNTFDDYKKEMEFTELFREHINQISSVTNKKTCLCGSAQLQMNTEVALKWIINTVTGEKQI